MDATPYHVFCEKVELGRRSLPGRERTRMENSTLLKTWQQRLPLVEIPAAGADGAHAQDEPARDAAAVATCRLSVIRNAEL